MTFLALFRTGLDTQQIADLTGCNEPTVYNMMHRERIMEKPEPKRGKRVLFSYWNGSEDE